MEQELKNYLETYEQRLQAIQYKKPGLWRAFFTGFMSGLGSVIGVLVALAIAAYILNKIGVIPAFKSEVTRLNQMLDLIEKSK